MKIPHNTISVSALRLYGSGGLRTDDHESDRGCPRRWKARYIDGHKDTELSRPLTYGSMLHRALEYMVANDVDPQEAILRAITPDVSPEMVDELIVDIERYLARPQSDFDDMATLGAEVDLKVPLYEDPEFGTIYIRAIIDHMGMDPNEPDVIHIKDYKSNRMPISNDDVVGDVQMRAYSWIVKQLADRWTDSSSPRVIANLDLVKFRNYQYEYTDDQLESWRMWAIAVCRTILRDEEAAPVVNAYCTSCPVRKDCPAFKGLPDVGQSLLGKELLEGLDLLEGRRWRDRANAVRLQLDKAVKAWDEEFIKKILEGGPVTLDDKTYTVEPSESQAVDVFAIYRLLGDDFPRIATVSKAAVDRSTLDESTKSQVLEHFGKEFSGSKLVARKAE